MVVQHQPVDGKHGYKNIDGDGVTFIKEAKKSNGRVSKIIIGLHVDDGIICTDDTEMYDRLVGELEEDFVLSSHGKLEYYLGWKIEQDLQAGTVILTQEQYTKDVLKRFQMDEANPVSTPSEPGSHLRAEDSPPLSERDAKWEDYKQNYCAK